jgi:hypothetical protein
MILRQFPLMGVKQMARQPSTHETPPELDGVCHRRNRQVEVSKAARVPAGLIRFLILGVWQWCPTRASWEADVEP